MKRVRNSRGCGVLLVWSASDLAYLREHYPTDASCDIASHLGVSDVSVRNKARELGLEKSSSFSRNSYRGRYTYNRR